MNTNFSNSNTLLIGGLDVSNYVQSFSTSDLSTAAINTQYINNNVYLSDNVLYTGTINITFVTTNYTIANVATEFIDTYLLFVNWLKSFTNGNNEHNSNYKDIAILFTNNDNTITYNLTYSNCCIVSCSGLSYNYTENLDSYTFTVQLQSNDFNFTKV